MTNKQKCDLARQIRKGIAEANGIVFLSAKCNNFQECPGSCAICDAEIAYLDGELNRLAAKGKRLTLASLDMDALYAIAKTANDTEHTGVIEERPPLLQTSKPTGCNHLCEFYSNCPATADSCVKEAFRASLKTLRSNEEFVVCLSYGIECTPQCDEKIAPYLGTDTECIAAIKSTALRRLRAASRAEPLRTSSIGLVLFGISIETPYSQLWRDIFGETQSSIEGLQKHFIKKQDQERIYRIAQSRKERELIEWEEKKKACQAILSSETPIKDCCFGNPYTIGTIEGLDPCDTVDSLLKLNGAELYKACGFKKELFEEIILVLGSRELYLADCSPREYDGLRSYIVRIYKTFINAISAETTALPIENLDLTVRAFNCLYRAGIQTIADLIRWSEKDIARIRNMGKRSFEEIVAKLASFGIELPKESMTKKTPAAAKRYFYECTGETKLPKILQSSVEELYLSKETLAHLKHEKINTIGDLVGFTRQNLYGIFWFSPEKIDEIETTLKTLGLSLGYIS